MMNSHSLRRCPRGPTVGVQHLSNIDLPVLCCWKRQLERLHKAAQLISTTRLQLMLDVSFNTILPCTYPMYMRAWGLAQCIDSVRRTAQHRQNHAASHQPVNFVQAVAPQSAADCNCSMHVHGHAAQIETIDTGPSKQIFWPHLRFGIMCVTTLTLAQRCG